MPGLIVHEWIEQYGGAEKVAEEFAAIFPDAAIACLWDDYPERFAGRTVTESWLSKTALRRHKNLALPLMLPTWRRLRAPGRPDWILCSSHLFAHHARVRGAPPGTAKFVYAYTPARYIWNPELDQRGDSAVARLAAKPLQTIDKARAQEATSIACVSDFVRQRIENTWNRDCYVIHPPVDVEFYAGSKQQELTSSEGECLKALPQIFVLGASRFVPYKRLDLVIEFGIVNQIPVVLAGSGPEAAALREIAASSSVPVFFVPKPSPALLRELYAAALAFVFPAVEDFGIMPVEAAAAGTPVIARSVGGTAETVCEGVSGFLLDRFSPSEMRSSANNLTSISAADSRIHAMKFHPSVFQTAIKQWITPTN